jgi:hypothetical protein
MVRNSKGGPISSLLMNGFNVEVKKLREGVVVGTTIGDTLDEAKISTSLP